MNFFRFDAKSVFGLYAVEYIHGDIDADAFKIVASKNGVNIVSSYTVRELSYQDADDIATVIKTAIQQHLLLKAGAETNDLKLDPICVTERKAVLVSGFGQLMTAEVRE